MSYISSWMFPEQGIMQQSMTYTRSKQTSLPVFCPHWVISLVCLWFTMQCHYSAESMSTYCSTDQMNFKVSCRQQWGMEVNSVMFCRCSSTAGTKRWAVVPAPVKYDISFLCPDIPFATTRIAPDKRAPVNSFSLDGVSESGLIFLIHYNWRCFASPQA